MLPRQDALRGDAHLRQGEIPDAIAAGVKAAQWSGIVLPQKRIGGSLLYPVVEIKEEAWTQRIEQSCGPEYVLSTLYLWESWTSHLGPMPPASALSIVGFVSDRRPQDARRALGLAGNLGAGLIVHTGARRPTTMTRFESDVAGLSLVWVAPDGPAETLVKAGRGR